ncbi:MULTISPECIES: hypothetical protein [Helcococcus]|uniref:hypothetical protein n=1 Tax=Helcococcus TaxID=31983 RepID=UPI00106FBB01|nr:hypothetical protein [Helcococcus ovis]TFF68362.1 hypothetical protein EQF93_02685 [Helcococcus ovis]WNZ00883.1 hypothetical protein EQF90_006355 [Helcococcus ovis]
MITRIDLNELMNRTVEIKINDTIVKVKDITVKQFERMLEIEQNNDSKGQIEIIAEILNNNVDGVNFDVKSVQNMTRPAVIALWTLFLTRSIDYTVDPN